MIVSIRWVLVVLLIGLTTAKQTRADLTTGLIHHWDFDETAGVIASDSAGGIDARLFNWGVSEPTWVPGMVGGALHFGDSNNYAITSLPIPSMGQFTVAFWLRQVEREGINPRLVTPRGEAWIYYNREHGNGVGIGDVRGDHGPRKEVWEHYTIAVDRTGHSAATYRDGIEVASGSVNLPAVTSPWVFGHNQDPNNGKDSWNGLMDDLRIYDRVITAGEAEQLSERPIQPEISATLVTPRATFGSPPGSEYDRKSVSVFLDPADTDWVAWNQFPDVRAMASSRPGEVFLGSHSIGVNDYLRLTVTNPQGTSLTRDLDKNGAMGAPSGPQSVIFRTSDTMPTVLRGDNWQDPFFFDEEGTHNSIFTVAGEYQFDFSFRDIGGGAGYPDVYLLVSADPQPLLSWDESGDGNWGDLDPHTEYSRWVDRRGNRSLQRPDDETSVVISINTVTVAADRSALDLTVESGRVVIAGNATLTLSESVTVEPEGSLTLSRDATLVADHVTVSGSIGGSDATVYSDVTVNGKLVMDDPAALLIVDGDLTFAPNAVLELAVDRRQTARVDATGQVKLEADSELHLLADGASPFTAGTYTLLTSDEALTGRFATSTGLGRYVSIGDNVDGLTYTTTTLTVTIDEDLNLGDANLSGRTDLSDFNIWNANKFTAGTGWTSGDFNGDGTTDLSDFNIWNAHKFTVAQGGAAPAPTEVPEPGTVALLIMGMAIGLAYRHRRRVLPRSG